VERRHISSNRESTSWKTPVLGALQPEARSVRREDPRAAGPTERVGAKGDRFDARLASQVRGRAPSRPIAGGKATDFGRLPLCPNSERRGFVVASTSLRRATSSPGYRAAEPPTALGRLRESRRVGQCPALERCGQPGARRAVAHVRRLTDSTRSIWMPATSTMRSSCGTACESLPIRACPPAGERSPCELCRAAGRG